VKPKGRSLLNKTEYFSKYLDKIIFRENLGSVFWAKGLQYQLERRFKLQNIFHLPQNKKSQNIVSFIIILIATVSWLRG